MQCLRLQYSWNVPALFLGLLACCWRGVNVLGMDGEGIQPLHLVNTAAVDQAMVEVLRGL